MLKTFGAIAAAAAIAAGATLIGATGDVAASTPDDPTVATLALTAPMTAPATARDCARGWPYVDPSCLKDAQGQPRRVRLVGIDRL